jgi:hypothetical protein
LIKENRHADAMKIFVEAKPPLFDQAEDFCMSKDQSGQQGLLTTLLTLYF